MAVLSGPSKQCCFSLAEKPLMKSDARDSAVAARGCSVRSNLAILRERDLSVSGDCVFVLFTKLLSI